jgi:hypothetical protein
VPFKQQAHSANDFPRAPPILPDVNEDGPQLVEVRRIFLQENFRRFGIAMDRAQGLIQFVRQGGCHFAEGRHPNVRVHMAATAVGKPPPWDWRLLINGYADQLLYERGDLVGQLAFADLRKQALVNEKAQAANDDPNFSRRIRDGVIGF